MGHGRVQFGPHLRKELHARFKGVCHLCERPISLQEITVDHVLPRKLGGTHEVNNLAPAHKKCNQRRGNMPMEAWLTLRKVVKIFA